MSIHVNILTISEPDSEFRTMKKVWDACEEAGVDAPVSVRQFFDHQTPNGNGVEIVPKDKYIVGREHFNGSQ